MKPEERQALINKVEREEVLTEQENILYFSEVLGMSIEDATFAATRKKVEQENAAKGIKVYL